MITIRMCSENIDVTLEKLEEVGKVLFEWFSNNFLKVNAEKCHLILSTDDRVYFSHLLGAVTARNVLFGK